MYNVLTGKMIESQIEQDTLWDIESRLNLELNSQSTYTIPTQDCTYVHRHIILIH